MSKQLSKAQQVDVIDSFTNRLESMVTIAARMGVTRQGIHKLLKRNGVKPAEYGCLDVSCFTCGKEFKKHRAQVRRALHVFCSYECYYAFLDAGKGGSYIESRQGQRRAREVVSESFELQPGHVVHHEDRNCLNNMKSNLKVFRNQGDHVRHHRGFEVDPVWDGSK